MTRFCFLAPLSAALVAPIIDADNRNVNCGVQFELCSKEDHVEVGFQISSSSYMQKVNVSVQFRTDSDIHHEKISVQM